MLFIILALSFGIKTKCKISQEEGLFVATFGIVILTYILGLINLLSFSIYIIGILSIISLVYTIVKLCKKQLKLKELLTLPTIIYCIAMIFVYYIVKDIKYMYYDEFMFWGTNLKVMLEKSCLWANKAVDGIHLIYPPFASIMQYICCKFNGAFNESVTYFGMATLIITSIMPLLKNERYNIKSFIKIVLIFVITYLGFILFYYNIACLSVDGLLAIFFAVAMFLAYKADEKKDYIILGILLIAITLTKTNGILLAGIVIMQIAISNIFELIKQKEKNIKNIAKKFSIVLILLVAIVSTYATWKMYYTLNGKQIDDRHDKNYTQNIDIEEFINAISQKEEASERNRKIANNFISNLMDKKIIRKRNYNTALWIFAIVNIIHIIYFIISKNKLRILSNFISINIGLVLYLSTILIVFMFVFQVNQGEELMGMERYVSTYFSAMLLNGIYLILENENWKKLIIGIIIMLILQKGMNSVMIDPRLSRIMDRPMENRVLQNSQMIKEVVKEDEKIYIIDKQENAGEEFMKTRYHISPIKTNLLYEWNVAIKSENMIYRLVITPKELIEKLITENYNYVYIISTNQNFIEDYQEIFSPEVMSDLERINTKEYKFLRQIENGILLKINYETGKLESIN